MIKNLKILLVSIITLIGILFPSCISYANTDSNNVGFDIQMVTSSKQKNKDVSYFDLRLSAKESETIYFLLNNTSDTDQKYVININQAYTNSQGFIDYTDIKKSEENNVPYKINDITSYDKKITVKAKSSVNVPVKITMPDESFDGEILAGIQVLKDQKNAQDQINVDYGYILGLRLTESDNEVKRDLSLSKVKADGNFGKPSIVASLKNPTMEAYGHLKYEVSVVNRKNKKNIFSKTYDNGMEIAPNSSYDLAILFENQRLVPGSYNLNLTVTDAKENKWTFTKYFEISSQEANKINSATIDAGNKRPSYLWLLVAIICLLIVLIILVLFFRRRHSRKENRRP